MIGVVGACDGTMAEARSESRTTLRMDRSISDLDEFSKAGKAADFLRPGPRRTAAFLVEANRPDDHAAIYRLAHVVDGQCGGRRQRRALPSRRPCDRTRVTVAVIAPCCGSRAARRRRRSAAADGTAGSTRPRASRPGFRRARDAEHVALPDLARADRRARSPPTSSTTPLAIATRAVSGLAPTATMCAAPRASKCVSFFFTRP